MATLPVLPEVPPSAAALSSLRVRDRPRRSALEVPAAERCRSCRLERCGGLFERPLEGPGRPSTGDPETPESLFGGLKYVTLSACVAASTFLATGGAGVTGGGFETGVAMANNRT